MSNPETDELEEETAAARLVAQRYYAARDRLEDARQALLDTIAHLYNDVELSQESIARVVSLDDNRKLHRSRIGQFLAEIKARRPA